MATKLKAYSSDGATLLETMALTANVGVAGSATPFRFVNDDSDGTVDPALQPSITVRQVNEGTGEAVLRGLRAVDEHWIQMRALGTGSAGDDHVATGWFSVGRGRELTLPALSSGGYHDMEIRYNPPLSAPEGQINFVLSAEDNQRVIAIERGHTEASRDGILSGIGDGMHTELVAFGGMTASGSPDDKVNFGDLAWKHEGVPHVKLAHAETLSGTDSASASLGSSEGYWCRFSVGAGAGVTQTKSVKFATGAADPDDVPDVPVGEINLGYALRTDDGTISGGDITNEAIEGGFAFANLSGLILTIGPGRARFDNELIRREARGSITLPASTSGVKVWAVGDGFAYGATRPDPRSYLLCKVDTGVSSITMSTLVDYRDPLGAERQNVEFFWAGVPAANAKAYAVHRSARIGYLRVPRGLVLAAASLGSGNTAGELRVDLKVNGTTAFTTGIGAGSKAPGLKWNSAAALDTAALPEVLEIPPFAFLEAKVTYPTAFDGTGPDNLVLSVTIEVP